MKITVGGREHITTAVLQVPDGEDAWLEFQAGTWRVRLNIIFIDDKEDSSQNFSVKGVDDHAVLTFKNWNRGLPAAVSKPFQLGEADNRNIVFIFSGYAVAGLKRLDISFFWESEIGQ